MSDNHYPHLGDVLIHRATARVGGKHRVSPSQVFVAGRRRGARSGLPCLPAASRRPAVCRRFGAGHADFALPGPAGCLRQTLGPPQSECDDCARSMSRVVLNCCDGTSPSGATTNSITDMDIALGETVVPPWHHRAQSLSFANARSSNAAVAGFTSSLRWM